MTIYAHLDPDTLHATVDNPGCSDVLVEQIKAWCQAVGNVVTVRPVIDLNTEISTNAYVPTEKLAEQVRLRDQCCVFPNCTRRARYCDLDHRVPFDHKTLLRVGRPRPGTWRCCADATTAPRPSPPGATRSPEPGVYDWTSPSGNRFRVVRGRRHGRMPITTASPDPPPAEP